MVARKCKRLRPEDGTPPVRLRTELRKESKLLSPAIPRQTSERGVIVSKNGLPRKPLTKRRLKNLILNVLKNPFNMVVLVSLIILFCLIIIPLLTMISSTFTLAQGELRRVQGHVGDFTLYYWLKDFSLIQSAASNLRLAINEAFAKEHIEIAFPQLDVHVKDMPPKSVQYHAANPDSQSRRSPLALSRRIRRRTSSLPAPGTPQPRPAAK